VTAVRAFGLFAGTVIVAMALAVVINMIAARWL
jgi:hypothetical protein